MISMPDAVKHYDGTKGKFNVAGQKNNTWAAAHLELII